MHFRRKPSKIHSATQSFNTMPSNVFLNESKSNLSIHSQPFLSIIYTAFTSYFKKNKIKSINQTLNWKLKDHFVHDLSFGEELKHFAIYLINLY